MNEYTEHIQVHRQVEEVQLGKQEKREKLAAVQHEIWSHWMKYFFTQCKHVNGGWLLADDKANRWIRQMNTSYDELSEQEKKSDREQADKVLAVLEDAT